MRGIALIACLAVACGDSPPPRVVADPCSARPTQVRIAAKVPIGGYANLVEWGAGAVWTITGDGTLVSIETGTGMVRRYPLRVSGETRIGIDELARALWLADPQTRSVTRFDLDDARLLKLRPFARNDAPREMAVGPDAIWIAAERTPRLLALDPDSGEVKRVVRVRGVREIADVTTAEDGIWISTAGDQRVLRLDLSTGRVLARSPRLGADTVEIAAFGGSAWVDLGDADALAHVDADGRVLQRRLPNGGDVFALAIGYGSVWVTNYGQHAVRRFHAETGQPQGAPIRVGREPKGITAEVDGGMWVANAGECTLSRIAP